MDATLTPEWRAVRAHAERLRDVHLRDLFAADPGRAERLRLQVGDVELDLSKHRVDDAALAALVELAGAAHVRQAIDAMFAGACPIHGNRQIVQPADKRLGTQDFFCVCHVHHQAGMEIAIPRMPHDGGNQIHLDGPLCRGPYRLRQS